MTSDKVFIIGNGFDISLGWKTKYSDFAGSSLWPFKNSLIGLSSHLEQKRNIEKWLDIEHELLEYVVSAEVKRSHTPAQLLFGDKTVEKDLFSFNILCNKLTTYLNAAQEMEIDMRSPAARIFEAVIKNGSFDDIYTFNYTDLQILADELKLGKVYFKYVHGSLENNDIILGIDDHENISSSYDFMYKTFNKNYTSSPINYSLQEANEVVFFGHSLGPTDYHYFKNFFKTQSQEYISSGNSKIITIFTFDNSSRLEILRQLRNMNGGSLEYLYSNNTFNIICTNGEDPRDDKMIQEFIQHLR